MIFCLVAGGDNAESVGGSAISAAVAISMESREKPFREDQKAGVNARVVIR